MEEAGEAQYREWEFVRNSRTKIQIEGGDCERL